MSPKEASQILFTLLYQYKWIQNAFSDLYNYLDKPGKIRVTRVQATSSNATIEWIPFTDELNRMTFTVIKYSTSPIASANAWVEQIISYPQVTYTVANLSPSTRVKFQLYAVDDVMTKGPVTRASTTTRARKLYGCMCVHNSLYYGDVNCDFLSRIYFTTPSSTQNRLR